MKKRLVTTAILVLVISLFFCSSVFADNIVIQGESDTVTATYGDNDVTVALRARKLRVINTGTAAAGYAGYTPVIVSVTIYNLGNQNCLVNNLKFRLTSESAEYRIAGFENISPDLFISDTAYDATGYLSLKASNDYTYAGGFVVPANSNMTYVGIINVSANWITENQTWRTVDLSTATFYDNMTTTIGNYPCAAEPIDLTNIENDIDSIVTSLSGIDYDVSTIHSLISDICDSVQYTGSHFIYNAASTMSSTLSSVDLGLTGFTASITRSYGTPYLIDTDVVTDGNNDNEYVNATLRYPFLFIVNVYNRTNRTVKARRYMNITMMFPTNISNCNIYVDNFYSPIFESLVATSSKSLQLNVSAGLTAGGYSYLPHGQYATYVHGYIDVPYGTNFTFLDFGAPTFGTPELSDEYYPLTQYEILRDIYLSLNPETTTNDPDDVNTESQSINSAVESIQTAEAQYFADNQEAIENTGLSNFHFNDNQVWSLTMIVDQFEAVWNALGEFTVVYIFTLMMSLATYLIRHEPTTKVKQWRESVSAERAERTSYYGRKNAEARAHDSTMKKAIRRR